MGDPLSPTNADKPYRTSRAVPRYTFIASVEVIEPVSGVRISGRISEISRKGCYVDALNNLPAPTPVMVRISRDQGTFTSPGKILYVQEGMGMGIGFLDPPADQLKLLDSWLTELTT